MAAVSTEMTMAEMLEVMLKEKYTRWPVTDGDKDSVIGLVNTKHLFSDLLFMTEEERMKMTIHPYVRPVIEVIETIPVHDLLIKMRRERIHMAILSDEYGGTSGLVTTEDILEEIVGEIRDEFDEDEQPLIQKLGDRHYVMDGKVRIDQVNSLLGASIQEDVDTIGGLILKENIDIEAGESIRIGSYTIKVLKMDGRLIKQIDIKKRLATQSGLLRTIRADARACDAEQCNLEREISSRFFTRDCPAAPKCQKRPAKRQGDVQDAFHYAFGQQELNTFNTESGKGRKGAKNPVPMMRRPKHS